jgi:hypothetical protein
MQQFVTPHYVSPEYYSDSLSKSSVRVMIDDRINVTEFNKAFEKRFGTGSQMAKELTEEVGLQLKLTFPSIVANNADSLASKFMLNAFLANDSVFTTKKQAYLSSMSEAYILLVYKIEISNEYVFHGGGGPYGGGGGSTEYCIVNYRVKIIRRADQKELLQLIVKGKDAVAFFDFQATLVGALNNSVTHLMGYLKDNTIEYLH